MQLLPLFRLAETVPQYAHVALHQQSKADSSVWGHRASLFIGHAKQQLGFLEVARLHGVNALVNATEAHVDRIKRHIISIGLALQLALQGTKYYKDDDLNKRS
ncbi:hypothetical protein [Edaphobacter aggregans]|uniref:hypothetical protein n=1 Tax=Edaphobacter aggregans TaxID=570835 RepID=UPI0012F8034C|nr:hypothetical protein [Edaphobacter aggregans]